MTTRIDKLMADMGLADTRTRAQNLIALGVVTVNGNTVNKPSFLVEENAEIVVNENYEASLGGIKLKEAIEKFNIKVKNKVCLDIGAANGGFTEVLLNNGAKKVFALDVGDCALPEYLKNNDRVIIKDRTNARYITKENFSAELEFCVIDVSFISLKLILPTVYSILAEKGEVIALIKPQFECGKNNLTKSGIVKSEKIRCEVVSDIISFAKSINFLHKGVIAAPRPFQNKNQEYLLYLCK